MLTMPLFRAACILFAGGCLAVLISVDLRRARVLPVKPPDSVIANTLDLINSRIELFKTQEGRTPNLVGKGWEELRSAGYIGSVPVNPVNGSDTITIGSTGSPEHGWHWDPASNRMGASFYDEAAGRITQTP